MGSSTTIFVQFQTYSKIVGRGCSFYLRDPPTFCYRLPCRPSSPAYDAKGVRDAADPPTYFHVRFGDCFVLRQGILFDRFI